MSKLEQFMFSRNNIQEFPFFLKNLSNITDIEFISNPYQSKNKLSSGYINYTQYIDFESVDGLNIFKEITQAIENETQEQENWINLKIPKDFKRVFSRYILLFSEYVSIAKGKIIEFHVRSQDDALVLVTNGKTNISREQVIAYLEEYVMLLAQDLSQQKLALKIENQEITNNPNLELKIDTFTLRYQVEKSALQSEMRILELENKHLQQELSIYRIQSERDNQRILFLQEMFERGIKIGNDSFDIEKVTHEIIAKLARMQERKSTQKHEDLHNDILTDFLRDKGYYITDQTRSKSQQASRRIGYDDSRNQWYTRFDY